MYHHVLVPVQLDESRDVASASSVAEEIADADGRITFLHVIEPVPATVSMHLPPTIGTERREDAKERLGALAEKVPGAHVAVVDGSAGRSITEWARDNDVDCITIPSHRPVLSDILLGSTAAWVVRHAQCAVHVVR